MTLNLPLSAGYGRELPSQVKRDERKGPPPSSRSLQWNRGQSPIYKELEDGAQRALGCRGSMKHPTENIPGEDDDLRQNVMDLEGWGSF